MKCVSTGESPKEQIRFTRKKTEGVLDVLYGVLPFGPCFRTTWQICFEYNTKRPPRSRSSSDITKEPSTSNPKLHCWKTFRQLYACPQIWNTSADGALLRTIFCKEGRSSFKSLDEEWSPILVASSDNSTISAFLWPSERLFQTFQPLQVDSPHLSAYKSRYGPLLNFEFEYQICASRWACGRVENIVIYSVHQTKNYVCSCLARSFMLNNINIGHIKDFSGSKKTILRKHHFRGYIIFLNKATPDQRNRFPRKYFSDFIPSTEPA